VYIDKSKISFDLWNKRYIY